MCSASKEPSSIRSCDLRPTVEQLRNISDHPGICRRHTCSKRAHRTTSHEGRHQTHQPPVIGEATMGSTCLLSSLCQSLVGQEHASKFFPKASASQPIAGGTQEMKTQHLAQVSQSRERCKRYCLGAFPTNPTASARQRTWPTTPTMRLCESWRFLLRVRTPARRGSISRQTSCHRADTPVSRQCPHHKLGCATSAIATIRSPSVTFPRALAPGAGGNLLEIDRYRC